MIFDAELPRARLRLSRYASPSSRTRLGCVAPSTTYTASGRLFRIAGIASIMISMPLLGESRPNVRMTDLPLKPSLAFAASGSTKATVGDAVRR